MNIGIITPVCQSLGVLPNFHATWHTRVNQRIPSPVSAFNISGLISFSPAAFPDFISLIAVTTAAAVKTSSSPKCVTSCVLRVDAFTGFKRSSKYSLHRERISFLDPTWNYFSIYCSTLIHNYILITLQTLVHWNCQYHWKKCCICYWCQRLHGWQISWYHFIKTSQRSDKNSNQHPELFWFCKLYVIS